MENTQKIEILNQWVGRIIDYLREIDFEIDPLPHIVYDDSPNEEDELFIKTGYYNPVDNELVLFIDNRHIKDILRTFCHEMIHRNQNLRDPEGFTQSASNLPLVQDPALKELEGDAYLNGNLLFRQFTEMYTHKDKTSSIVKESKMSKKELEEMAKKHKDELQYHLDNVNKSFTYAVSDIEKEYGISVQHDLGNHHEVWVDERGNIGGYYELISSDNQRRHAKMFDKYTGEVHKSDEESLQDLNDAAEIMKNILTKEIADFGINGSINVAISTFDGYQTAKFTIVPDEETPKEIQDTLMELHNKEFRKSMRRRRW